MFEPSTTGIENGEALIGSIWTITHSPQARWEIVEQDNYNTSMVVIKSLVTYATTYASYPRGTKLAVFKASFLQGYSHWQFVTMKGQQPVSEVPKDPEDVRIEAMLEKARKESRST